MNRNPAPSAVAFARLAALYRAVADESGGDCRACGRCCHFDEMDHIVFAGALERAYLREGAGSPPTPAGPGRCPYQQREQCIAHAWRPLGCRLFFCGPDDPDADFRAERHHGALKTLHTELAWPWDYAPLLHSLKDESENGAS